MPGPKNLLAIDFGTEYIRITQTRYDPAFPLELNPQGIEFSGSEKGFLRNCILMTPRLDHIIAVGDDAHKVDETATAENFFIRGVPLDARIDDKIAQRALPAIFETIRKGIGINDLDETQLVDWVTLAAIPTISPFETGELIQKRLHEAGFPSPSVYPTALTIFRSYFPHEVKPGCYLVIDGGYRNMRFSLYTADADGSIRLLSERESPTGGKDIDQILLKHFQKTLEALTVSSSIMNSELEQFVSGYKVRFLKEIMRGRQSYTSIFPLAAVEVNIEVDRDEFFESMLRPLISEFRTQGERILRENQVGDGQMEGILLAGGNVRWPFVRQWAEETAGAEKICMAACPEEAVVQGLVQLYGNSPVKLQSEPAFEQSPVRLPAQQAEQQAGQAPLVQAPRPKTPLPPAKKRVSPWLGFIKEFGFGLIGILGMGWFWELHSVVGCATLIAWWVVLGLAILVAAGSSAFALNPVLLLAILPVYLSGPLVSGALVYWRATEHNKKLE